MRGSTLLFFNPKHENDTACIILVQPKSWASTACHIFLTSWHFCEKKLWRQVQHGPPTWLRAGWGKKDPLPYWKSRKSKQGSTAADQTKHKYIYIYMSIHFMYMSTFKTARRASTSSSIVAADVTAVARVLKSLTLAERKRNFRRYQKSKCQTVSDKCSTFRPPIPNDLGE